MAMTQYTGETEVISKLGTTPQERGLSTEQFKAKFDEGLKGFVEWFNSMHKTQFDAKAETTSLNALQNEVNEHLADNMTERVGLSRDLSLTGKQTLATEIKKTPKMIIAFTNVSGTQLMCWGMWAEVGGNRGYYSLGNNFAAGGGPIIVGSNTTDRTLGAITNVEKGSFTIDWTHTGAGASGTASISFLVFYHGGDEA